MSRSRTAPDRIRSRYLRALNALPLTVQLAHPIEVDRLTVLGTHTIADRTVNFATMASAPRLWLAFADRTPALIGYMTGLIIGEPELWLCETAHRDWVLERDHTPRLKEAAAIVWFTCQQTCES
ncbi:hypothetical protein [Glycomyces tenuis]|uniref:hypothetical protein n=1 Tax=Glycomyces tenuis TaxID=58116 RepID=UPI0004109DA6|nr:hypothetical protein [Glycomyces tenuis]